MAFLYPCSGYVGSTVTSVGVTCRSKIEQWRLLSGYWSLVNLYLVHALKTNPVASIYKLTTEIHQPCSATWGTTLGFWLQAGREFLDSICAWVYRRVFCKTNFLEIEDLKIGINSDCRMSSGLEALKAFKDIQGEYKTN